MNEHEGKYFGEILSSVANFLSRYNEKLETIAKEEKKTESSLRELLKKMVDITNKEINVLPRPKHLINQCFVEYEKRGNSLSEAVHWRKWYESLHGNIVSSLNSRDSIIKTKADRLYLTNIFSIFHSAHEKINKASIELKTHQYNPLNSDIDFDQDNAIPVYNIYSHSFDQKYFPPEIRPINSRYIASLVNSLRINDQEEIKYTIECQKRILEKMEAPLYKEYEEAMNSYDNFWIAKRNPQRNIVEKNPLYQDLKKEVDNLLDLVNKKNTDPLKAALSNLNRSSSELSTVLKNLKQEIGTVSNHFATDLAEDNALHLTLQQTEYVTNMIQYTDITTNNQIYSLLGQWKRKQDTLEKILSDILTRGISESSPVAIMAFQEELDQYTKIMSGSFIQAKGLLNEKEKQYRDLAATAGKLKKCPDAQYIQMQKELQILAIQINQESSNKISQFQELEKQVCSAMLQISEVENDSFQLSEVSSMYDDSPIQVIKRLEMILSDYKACILNKQQEMAKLMATQAIAPRPKMDNATNNLYNFDFSQVSQVLKPYVTYSNLRSMISCPNCENEATHCIGKCGHLICSDCIEKMRKDPNMRCHVCGIDIHISDFIQINW